MLFSGAEIWRDIRTSLLEIFAGVIFSGALAFIVSAILLIDRSVSKWALSILSLTVAIPMVMLPAWLGSLLSQGEFTWHAVWLQAFRSILCCTPFGHFMRNRGCVEFFWRPIMHYLMPFRHSLRPDDDGYRGAGVRDDRSKRDLPNRKSLRPIFDYSFIVICSEYNFTARSEEVFAAANARRANN